MALIWVVFDGQEPESAVIRCAESLDDVYSIIENKLYNSQALPKATTIRMENDAYADIQVECASEDALRVFRAEQHRVGA